MRIEVYCDESRQDLLYNKNSIREDNRYTIIGGIWIDSEVREDFKDDIKYLKKKYNTFGEIKWQNVTNSKLEFYEELINLFFKYTIEVKFRCIVIDAEKVDIDTYHDSDAELGFYKFYYHLLYHWLDNSNKYYIYTDYKKNRKTDRLIELKRVLNRAKKFDCVNHIQAINSKESLILQLEDVIMGAVGYKYNFGDKGKSKAKRRIVKLIEEKNRFPIGSTCKSEEKFNIFEIDLSYRGRFE